MNSQSDSKGAGEMDYLNRLSAEVLRADKAETRVAELERQLAEAVEIVCRLLGQRETERAGLLRELHRETPEAILEARGWFHDHSVPEGRALAGEGG